MKKLILGLLTMLPFSSVSVLAQAKINEINHEGHADRFSSFNLLESRRLLWNPGHTVLTLDQMYKNFSERSGLATQEELDSEFAQRVQTLIDSGLLEVSDGAGSMSPSIR